MHNMEESWKVIARELRTEMEYNLKLFIRQVIARQLRTDMDYNLKQFIRQVLRRLLIGLQ